MRRCVLAGVLLSVLTTACVLPVVADDSESSQASETSLATSTSGSARCDDESDRREKALLEYKARYEAEKRERAERCRRDCGPGGTVIVIDSTDNSTETTSVAYSYAPEKKRPASFAGILFAPGQGGKSAAYGIQWMGSKNVGAVLWMSGKLTRDEDVINTMIPHDDYYLEDSKGSYALEGIVGFGSRDAMLILGGGLAVWKTLYTAVSNVTGWRWNAGSDSSVKLAGQAGLRFRIADRFSLHFGYDTSQFAFFGLSGSF